MKIHTKICVKNIFILFYSLSKQLSKKSGCLYFVRWGLVLLDFNYSRPVEKGYLVL